MNEFFAQYRDARWQKLAARMKEAAEWRCQNCDSQSEQLHVHHRQYFKGRKVWEYETDELQVLCRACHQKAHDQNDIVKGLLSRPCHQGSLASVLGGFLHHDENLRYGTPHVLAAAQAECPIGYAAGFVAKLCEANLSLEQIRYVSEFIASLTHEHSEARMQVRYSNDVFGSPEQE